MAQSPEPPPVVVFYSFKGGVGRSMALINAACILAGRGRRVLAMDLDLEAPGISYLLSREKPGHAPAPGFVDLLHDFLTNKELSALGNPDTPTDFLKFTQELDIPKEIRTHDGGSLRIMPAGTMNAGYEDRRQAVDLPGLYRRGQGQPAMQHLRAVLQQSGKFDYIFVDSRTGFSDEAGISIRDLGDHLMVVLGLNRQNVEGTARFMERLRNRDGLEKKARQVEFIASPIPLGEDELYERRVKEAEEKLTTAWAAPVQLRLQVPYHPRLALDEELFVFRRTQGALHGAYVAIEQRVREITGDTAANWAGRGARALSEGNQLGALKAFSELARYDREQAVRWLQQACWHNLGNKSFDGYYNSLATTIGENPEAVQIRVAHLTKLKKYNEVEHLYRQAIRLHPDSIDIIANFANFMMILRKHDEAEGLYRRALELSPMHSGIIGNFASFLTYVRKDYDKAEEFYRRALELDPTHASNNGNFANFLMSVRGNHTESERFYHRALELEPRNADTNANFASFLLSRRRWNESRHAITRAWQCVDREHNQATAEVIFYRGLLSRVKKSSDTRALAYLKTIIKQGFDRASWSFDHVLTAIQDRVSKDDFSLYAALAAAILDPAEILPLDAFPRWLQVEPRPLGDAI